VVYPKPRSRANDAIDARIRSRPVDIVSFDRSARSRARVEAITLGPPEFERDRVPPSDGRFSVQE
jgi:hypothetical protein